MGDASRGRGAARGAGAVARPAAGRPRVRAVRPSGGGRGSKSCGSRRSRTGSTPTCAAGATELVGELQALVARAPAERAAARPADARAVPLGAPGRGAGRLPRARATPCRGARDRAEPRAPGARARDPAQDPALERRCAAAVAAGPRRASSAASASSRAARALDDALGGRGGCVLIAGEPGIGKSRLVDELDGPRAGRAGRAVLAALLGGRRRARLLAVGAVAARLRPRRPSPDALRAQLGAGAPELAQLVPELRELLRRPSRAADARAEGARFRLFEAVSCVPPTRAQDRPLVVGLDDLHAADEPSLLLLRFVAREIADSRLLVVVAFRDVDPTLRDPLAAALAELVRERHTPQIALRGLSRGGRGGVHRAVERDRACVRDVEASTPRRTGNPLFVAELVRLLDAEGRIADRARSAHPAGGARGHRPADRPPVGACRDLLVAGRRCWAASSGSMPWCGSASYLATSCSMPWTRQAERIVGDVPGAGAPSLRTRADPRHAVRRADAGARMRLHRDAGEALEAVHAEDLEAHSPSWPTTTVPPRRPGRRRRRSAYARRAGDRAAPSSRTRRRSRLYEMALTLVDGADARAATCSSRSGMLTRGRATRPRRSRSSARLRSWPRSAPAREARPCRTGLRRQDHLGATPGRRLPRASARARRRRARRR